jgi:hypothetical protein
MLAFALDRKISMKRNILISLILACAFSAQAGPYTSEMSKCLVDQTSAEDKTTLVRWLFVTLALHPDVTSIANTNAEERDNLNRGMAEIVERLITKSCRKEATTAAKYEGRTALTASFRALGQAAVSELMGSAQVSAGLSEFAKYLDEQKISEVLKSSNF